MKRLTTYFGLILISISLFQSVQAQSVPPSPANLTVEQQGTSAKLNWDGSPDASWYRVYKSADSSSFELIAAIHATSYTDPAVSSGVLYRYYVTATNYVGESLPSNDVLFGLDFPPPGSRKGFIMGEIKDDSTLTPINCVRLRFYKPDGFLYFREARTDSLGHYKIHLDTGSYYIYASKWTYRAEWYDDSPTRENAALVPVSYKDTVFADFGLTRIDPPTPPRLVSVSGIVTDSATASPIKDAFVVIMRSTRQINLIQNQEGNLFGNRNETFMIPGFGTLTGVMRVVRTADDGSYAAMVPDSMSYVMLAFKLGYIPEFYDNKFSPYDADRLFTAGDMTGINFDLVINPDAQNSVAGQVKSSVLEGVLSKVVLFKKTPLGIFPLRCGITDTAGNYSFGYLYSGYYYAKAYPFTGFAPAWYSVDSCGIGCWVNADSFLVDGATAGVDICVQPVILSGFASISGGVIGSDGSDIQGATVYAVSALSNSVAGYDITEADGNYSIQNLPPGVYRIVADKEGFVPDQSPVYSVDAANNFTVIDAGLVVSDVTLGARDPLSGIPVQFDLGQNYPNPFNPSTKISFSVPASSRIVISVFNLLGQQVNTIHDGTVAAGAYAVEWNGQDYYQRPLGSGIYIYRLSAYFEDGRKTFTDFKKMILIK